MTVALLKIELQKRGLSRARNKLVLKQKFINDMDTNVQVRTDNDEQVYPNPEDDFSNTVNWVDLTCKEVPVNNSTNEGFHAPSNRAGTEENAMYDFIKTFDRPVFQEKSVKVELTRDGRNYKLDGKGKPKYFKK